MSAPSAVEIHAHPLSRSAQGSSPNWPNVLFMILFHVLAIAALFFFTWSALAVALILWFVSVNRGGHLYTAFSARVNLGGALSWLRLQRLHLR